MASKAVTIADIGLVTLYKRRGSRSLRLSVGLNGQVRVSLPYWLPYKAAEEFAKRRAGWIEQQKKQHVAVLENGQMIGKAHRVLFTPGPKQHVAARVSLTEIRIQHPSDMPSNHPDLQQKARAAGIRALRQEAERLLPRRLQKLAEAYGFTYNSVGIKQLKSRWGSCSSRQEITLNLFLMQLPWRLIDYVLLHELTHTVVMQHGRPFWKELERHLPAARSLREEINHYQPVLEPSPADFS